jgi:hypothetical protein
MHTTSHGYVVAEQIIPITRQQSSPRAEDAVYGTDTVPRAARAEGRWTKALLNVEPMTGIEPAYSAWEAGVRLAAKEAAHRIQRVPLDRFDDLNIGAGSHGDGTVAQDPLNSGGLHAHGEKQRGA